MKGGFIVVSKEVIGKVPRREVVFKVREGQGLKWRRWLGMRTSWRRQSAVGMAVEEGWEEEREEMRHRGLIFVDSPKVKIRWDQIMFRIRIIIKS